MDLKIKNSSIVVPFIRLLPSHLQEIISYGENTDRRSFCREFFTTCFFFLLPGVPHFGRAGHRHGFHHRVGFSQHERAPYRQLLEPPFLDGSHDHGPIRHTGSQNGNRVSVLTNNRPPLLTAPHRQTNNRLSFFFCNPNLFQNSPNSFYIGSYFS